ncbi:hypothetical protein WG66_003906 [Moniliophthora roreri]|nr:hypothetical protein WG66_003906 [Moniliophthora roreri]
MLGTEWELKFLLEKFEICRPPIPTFQLFLLIPTFDSAVKDDILSECAISWVKVEYNLGTKGLRNRALDLSPPTPDFHAKFAPASIP